MTMKPINIYLIIAIVLAGCNQKQKKENFQYERVQENSSEVIQNTDLQNTVILNYIPNISCSIPQGAFYVFPNFNYYLNTTDEENNKIETSNDLCLYLLNKTGVVCVSGESFGAPGHIRFSYATSKEIISTAMNLVSSAIKKLSF